jgi:hypothetical protein
MSTITVSPSGLKFISDIVKEISKIENSWFDLDLSSQNAIKNILSKYELNQKDPNSRNDMFQLLFSNIIQDLYGNEIYSLTDTSSQVSLHFFNQPCKSFEDFFS